MRNSQRKKEKKNEIMPFVCKKTDRTVKYYIDCDNPDPERQT